jgi:hypothetical protein
MRCHRRRERVEVCNADENHAMLRATTTTVTTMPSDQRTFAHVPILLFE